MAYCALGFLARSLGPAEGSQAAILDTAFINWLVRFTQPRATGPGFSYSYHLKIPEKDEN